MVSERAVSDLTSGASGLEARVYRWLTVGDAGVVSASLWERFIGDKSARDLLLDSFDGEGSTFAGIRWFPVPSFRELFDLDFIDLPDLGFGLGDSTAASSDGDRLNFCNPPIRLESEFSVVCSEIHTHQTK
jgi:hypothetical protein